MALSGIHATILVLGSVILCGCSDRSTPVADGWVGKWNGPEGTWLDIESSNVGYEVEVKDLDAAKKYDGVAKGDTIEFTRNGKTETVKAATGVETGMKGFEKETNCLVTTKGSEGFCKKQ